MRPSGRTIENIKTEDGKLSFDRLDESVPFPLPDDARTVLPLYPTIPELSQYMLKVEGLKGDKFQLKINNMPVATLSGKELAEGVNLTAFAQGPIAAQGKEILAAVSNKEGAVGQWRAKSKDLNGEVEKLAPLTEQVEQADAKIPPQPSRKLHFEISAEKCSYRDGCSRFARRARNVNSAAHDTRLKNNSSRSFSPYRSRSSARVPHALNAALADDGHAVAQALHLAHDVGREDDALALLTESFDALQYRSATSTSRPAVGSSKISTGGS